MAVIFVPGGPATVTGTAGDDIIFASASQLAAGLSLDGGGGRDRLILLEGGTFDLRQLASFTNIEVVEMQERTAANRQTLYLRDGTAVTVEVTGTLGTDEKGVVIYGADNSDTIRLGSGFDTVTLGGNGEKVVGGLGRSEIIANQDFLNATVTGGARGANVVVTGNGTAVMGEGFTNLTSVRTQKTDPHPVLDFTAPYNPNLVVDGGEGDTLRAGGPHQTLVPSLVLFGRSTSALYGDEFGSTTFENPFGFGGSVSAQAYGMRQGSVIHIVADSNGDPAFDDPANVVIEFENGVLRFHSVPFYSQRRGDYYVRLQDDADPSTFLFPGGFQVVSDGNGGTFVEYRPYETSGVIGSNVFALTAGVDNLTTTDTSDGIVARAGTLGAGDVIDARGGLNDILWLDGAGTFDLRKPTLLTGIETLSIREGSSSNRQEVWLRDGTALTVEVRGSLDNYGSTFAFSNGVTIHGAKNTDTIKLGPSYDVVHLADSRTTVIGGAGSVAIFADARLLSATLSGGGGGGTLYVTGGGIGVMGSGITRMQTVVLVAGGPAYDFTANALSGLTIQGTSGHDTIRAGGANQVIASGGGADHLVAAAAGHTTFRNGFASFNGAMIDGFGGDGDVIDVSDVAAADLGFTYSGGVLTLSRDGSSSQIMLSGSFSASGFHEASDGRGGTAITYAAPAMAGVIDEVIGRTPSPLENAAGSGVTPLPPSHDKSILGLASAS